MGLKLFRSSAGSGKTFTLVLEYLTLLYRSSSPYAFRHILALTFTRKATAEMKHRIVGALQSFQTTDSSDDPLKRPLRERLPMSEDEFMQKSKAIYRALLHGYDRFNVTTIDSFLVGLVRSFGPELNTRAEASIELNTEKVRFGAAEKLLKKSISNKELTAVLLTYIEELLNDGRSWRFDRDFLKFSALLHDVRSFPPVEELRQLSNHEWSQIEKKVNNITNSLETKLHEIGKKAIHVFDSNGIEKGALRNRGVLYNLFVKFTEIRKHKDLDVASPQIFEIIEEDKWYASKASAEDKRRIDGVKPIVIELYRTAQFIIDRDFDEYLLAIEIRKKMHQMVLLRELAMQEEFWKEEHRVVLLKDIEQMIFRLLSQDSLPFVYERTGNEISHILIDEFQDTSERQWSNLLPLVMESVSKGGEVTIVGDAKQAIYRWRGGDSSLINALPQLTDHTLATFAQLRTNSLEHYLTGEDVLGHNYRSSPNVVAFNNAVFQSVQTQNSESVSSTYRDVQQKTMRNDPVGHVHFQFNTEATKREEFEIWAKNQLLERLDELKSRGYCGNDIAILVRKGKESELILSWLYDAGIQAVSPDSLLLQSSPQVRLLVDLIKWLRTPADMALNAKIYLQLAGKTTPSNISARPLHHIAATGQPELQFSVFLEVLKEMGYVVDIGSLMSLSPYGQILELVHIFKLDSSADGLLSSWLNIIHNECQRNNRSLADILEMWEWNKSAWRLETLELVEAVNVLTIHKAKGLAWPVVILYHFNWPNRGKNVWVKLNPDRWIIPYAQISESCKCSEVSDQLSEEANKKNLDELNTLYVAFTRPKNELYGFISKPNRKDSPFQKIYQAILGVKDELPIETEGSNDKITRISMGRRQPKTHSIASGQGAHPVEIKNIEYQSITDLFSAETVAVSDEAKLGTSIHECLSQCTNPEEFKTLLNKIKTKGNISEHDFIASVEAFDQLWLNDDFRRFFDASNLRLSERELIDHQGATLRPDLVLHSDGVRTVVDFKTGKPQDDDKNQVRQYMKLVEEITGDDVHGYLVYFFENRVEEVV